MFPLAPASLCSLCYDYDPCAIANWNKKQSNCDLCRASCHQYRQHNRKVYPVDHPMHGASAYDPLMIRKAGDKMVEIIKLEGVEFSMEEIK